MGPATVTEGVVPLMMNQGDFFISGRTWTKFHAKHPRISFKKFWEHKLRQYSRRSEETRRFFVNFQRNSVEHASTLHTRFFVREMRRLERIDEGVPYTAPFGLVDPKIEPEDTYEYEPPEYVYMRPRRTT